MLKVLVTGANGMLGQDLCPILERNGYEVFKTDLSLNPQHSLAGVGADVDEAKRITYAGEGILDITDLKMARNVITEQKPDIVIHCAAYTNVDKAEEDYQTAHKINVIGTENISKICGENDITLVYISTDYVFDGKKNTPYETTDKTNPINNYGLTKLKGEEAVKKHCHRYYITRTSWLYGKHGKNFVDTMIKLGKNPELKVVNDQTGCPTWTVELSNGITKLLQEQKPYGIYHICGSGETTWYNFAKEIFELTNLTTNLSPCTTKDFPRPAKRPGYSVMNNEGICRHWQEALKEYINISK